MSKGLTEMQKSALGEAGNIGSGHAAIALSQLMGKKIMIAVPNIEILKLSQLNKIFKGDCKNIIQINFSLLGDVKGVMGFILNEKMAGTLCDIIMGQPKKTTVVIGNIEQSALKEISNIVCSSYLNAINEMTRLSLLISAPEFNMGDIKYFKKTLIQKDIESEEIDKIFCIETEFIEASTKVEGYLIFGPSEHSIKKILNALGV
ncbi:chemotaxis protein CheC [Candidatus Poribacteria bacterium]|nr:chemotaxis protein CheC [Candidatus Poribacteria bacterium]